MGKLVQNVFNPSNRNPKKNILRRCFPLRPKCRKMMVHLNSCQNQGGRVPFKDIKAGCHYYENLCKNMLVFVCKI